MTIENLTVPMREAPHDSEPIIMQRLAGLRLRLDPRIIQELSVWLICMSTRWFTESVQTLRGKKGLKRKQALGRIRYAKTCLSAVEQIIMRLPESVRMVDYDDAWEALNRKIGYDGAPVEGEATETTSSETQAG